ncbi:type II toxin-antitoxin system VapC family toxin [Longimicrobium sp.]|jgi:predicted nucleic acid-binding protein|uniref:type II toxin-antitoxin system VapC family toxin n=1 Tax=Longimicrobium sp. TaxID=2029185 RepID=UPI002F923102
MKYIVDTQMLVRALRSEVEARRYRTFLTAFSSSVYLCSVVAQELLAGSRKAEARRLRELITRFEKLQRTAAPTHASWKRAGEILCRLRRAGFTITPSLTNDVLIACTATQIGAEVIHDNARDYRAIQARLSFRHRTDYPPVAP